METTQPELETTRRSGAWLLLLPVALACLGGGWLALVLGDGAAEKSPIWLPAGVALAALLVFGRSALPGVWAGCAAFWLWTLDARIDWPLAVALACAPLVGASTSLWFGRWLVRWIPAGGELLAIVGALPGSALATGFALAVLTPSGVVEPGALAERFARAWLADVAGVLILVPLAVAHLEGSRAWTVHVALSLGVAATLGLVQTMRASEMRMAATEIQQAVDVRAVAIQSDFSEVLEAIDSLGAFVAATDDLDAEKFAAYSQHIFARTPALRALEWLPRVPVGERAAHEAEAVSSGIPGYQILEPDPEQRVRAAERETYFPVRFVAPLEPNASSLGVDLVACPLMGSTLERAGVALDLAVSPSLPIDGGFSLLVALPVFPGGADPFAAPDHDALAGFVAAVVHVGDLVEGALARLDDIGLDSLMLERDSEGTDVVVHAHAAKSRGRPLGRDEIAALLAMRPGEAFRTAVPLGDRNQSVLSAPTAELRAGLLTWAPIGALAAGWIISALVASWLSSIASRTRRVETLVLERTRELAAANSAKTAFLANMSHEVRTPMTAILGYADALAEWELSEAERPEVVETIRRNARHLLAILDDVLDISKIESGRMDVERVPCSLVELVEDTLALLRGRAREKGISLTVDYRSPIPERIQSDPGRVRQILMNLVSNAIKFTESGGVRVAVWASDFASAEPSVQVEVADDGIGIEPESLARLFQPFVQADSSMTRRFGGTGLGLAISRRLAQLLGGDIEVESAPGQGSRFRLRLDPGPLSGARAHAGPIAGDGARVRARDEQDAPLRGRVLLADDTHDMRVLLRHFLTRAGLSVEFAENGREALQRALAAQAVDEPFELVLMDMQMPELDGYEATRALRAVGYAGPIVALTAHAMPGEREKCLAAGCDDYATKPIDRATLLAVVRRWLEKSRTGG